MNLPPALTWLNLFASNAACVCDTASPPPDWFAQMLFKFAGNGVAGAPRMMVAQGKSFHDMVDLPQFDGLVAINCPQVTTARLESAGFTYARKFAVMPSLSNARWFLPLDSGSIAAAGLSLYTPARRSAHLKKAALKAAARLHVPLWYRDSIVIASRQMPPLESKLALLFPGQQIRVALSSGAPEPAINRKASAVVLGAGGRVLAFVKISGSDISRRIVEHEATVLPALADRAGMAASVPRLLFAGEIDGRYITVQSPLAGKAAVAKLTPAHKSFLASLRNGQVKPAAATQMVATMPARIAVLSPTPRAQLSAILHQLMPTLESMNVPSTVIHGDFAPWNLRTHDGKISAFDWEYGELDGLPLVDETHFLLQLGSQLYHWNVDQAHNCLREIAASKPLGLSETQVRAIHSVYLLDSLVRLLNEGYDPDDEMLAWYRQLLHRLVPAGAEAVAA